MKKLFMALLFTVLICGLAKAGPDFSGGGGGGTGTDLDPGATGLVNCKTYAGGACSEWETKDIGTDVQAWDDDLDTLASPTAWRFFYSSAVGAITELALGADTTWLRSNGSAAAPTWNTAAQMKSALGYYTSGDTILTAGITMSKTTGVAGSMGVYEANGTDTSTVGWLGPSSIASSWWYQFNSTAPTGNQVMVFGVSTGSSGPNGDPVSPQTWATLAEYKNEKFAVIGWSDSAVISSGATSKWCSVVPSDYTLTGIYANGDTTTTSTIHLYKDAFSASNLASTDMTGGHDVVITTAVGTTFTYLPNWTTTINAGDQICGEVHANDAAKKLQVTLYGTH